MILQSPTLVASDQRSTTSSLCALSNDQSLSFLVCEMEMLAHNQFWGVKGIIIEKHLTSLEPSPYLLKLRITPASLTSCYQHSSILSEPPEVLGTTTYSHTQLPGQGVWYCKARSQPWPGAPQWQKLAVRAAGAVPVPAELVAESRNLAPFSLGLNVVTVVKHRTTRKRNQSVWDSIKEMLCWDSIPKAGQGRSH